MATNNQVFPCTIHPNCSVNDAGYHMNQVSPLQPSNPTPPRQSKLTHSNTDLDKILKVFWERAMLAATQSFAGDPYTITSKSAKAKLEALITARVDEARRSERAWAYKNMRDHGTEPQWVEVAKQRYERSIKANPEQEER